MTTPYLYGYDIRLPNEGNRSLVIGASPAQDAAEAQIAYHLDYYTRECGYTGMVAILVRYCEACGGSGRLLRCRKTRQHSRMHAASCYTQCGACKGTMQTVLSPAARTQEHTP